MTTYRLVNPHIEGGFKKIFSGNSARDAAEDAWKSLAKHFTNNVPKFAFTLQQNSDNSLHHFGVKEFINNNKMVEYNVTEMNTRGGQKAVDKFKEELSKQQRTNKMSGGKDKDKDDDSSSSSSSDDDSDSSDIYAKIRLHKLMKRESPIVYWWYDPSIYDIDYFYVPTFVSTISPYMKITTTNTYYGF